MGDATTWRGIDEGPYRYWRYLSVLVFLVLSSMASSAWWSDGIAAAGTADVHGSVLQRRVSGRATTVPARSQFWSGRSRAVGRGRNPNTSRRTDPRLASHLASSERGGHGSRSVQPRFAEASECRCLGRAHRRRPPAGGIWSARHTAPGSRRYLACPLGVHGQSAGRPVTLAVTAAAPGTALQRLSLQRPSEHLAWAAFNEKARG